MEHAQAASKDTPFIIIYAQNAPKAAKHAMLTLRNATLAFAS